MDSQGDGSGGGIPSFHLCGKNSWGYGDRIPERYPAPSKSQSRFP